MSSFFPNFVMLDPDPDPHSEKLLDPDLQKINADPQPCYILVHIQMNVFMFNNYLKKMTLIFFL